MSGQRAFVLPTSIVSPTDVSRLLREIESLENYFQQAEIRQSGEAQGSMPRLSKLLDNLATENQLNLLQAEHRGFVQKSLEMLHASAPVIHMSFSVDPPGSYTQKIVSWLRANIHSTVLVTVGLQPNIGAGCVIRTTNQIFDFSLREYFHAKRDFFIRKMHNAIVDVPRGDAGDAEDGVQAEAQAAAEVQQQAAPEVTPAAAPAAQPQPEAQPQPVQASETNAEASA